MVNNKTLLKEMCDIFSPSGFENEMADFIVDRIGGLCDELSRDRMHNVIALVKGKSSDKKLMLSAHMDEVGL